MTKLISKKSFLGEQTGLLYSDEVNEVPGMAGHALKVSNLEAEAGRSL